MNIVIIGESELNDILKKEITEAGYIPVVIEDIYSIDKINGEKYKYTVDINGKSIETAFIIITEEYNNLNEELAEIPFLPINEINEDNYSRRGKRPLVFLMDFPDESSTLMSAQALEKAVRIARKKSLIYYLSKFIKTSGMGFEKLYSEARNYGVTFIKYTKIIVDYNSSDEIFNIAFSDGYDEMSIQSDAVVLGQISSKKSRFKHISELLRLKFDENEQLNDGRYFLYPSLTSRNGVYCINRASSDGTNRDIRLRTDHVLSEIKKELRGISENYTSCEKALRLSYGFSDRLLKNPSGYARIDASKCALCYTCFRACPHAAMVPDKENQIMKNLKYACNACGICASVCPAKAIEIVDENDVQEMADAAKGNKENTNTESIVGEYKRGSLKILCCENSAKYAIDKIQKSDFKNFEEVDIETVPCGGSIEAIYLLDLLKNFEKVLVAVCMNDACKHFEGNKRAFKQVQKVKKILKETGFDENRVECIKISHAMTETVREYVLSDSSRGDMA